MNLKNFGIIYGIKNMEEIFDILIGFYNGLGMPYKFVRKFFVNNVALYESSYKLNSDEAQEFINSCAPLKKSLTLHNLDAFWVFQRKKTKNGIYAWGITVLSTEKKYRTNWSVFCEKSDFPTKFIYLLTRNFSTETKFLHED